MYCTHAGNDAYYRSEAEPTKDTSYLAVKGELWGIFREYFGEKWPRYNGTTMYTDVNIHEVLAVDCIIYIWIYGNTRSCEILALLAYVGEPPVTGGFPS